MHLHLCDLALRLRTRKQGSCLSESPALRLGGASASCAAPLGQEGVAEIAEHWSRHAATWETTPWV